MIRRVVLRGLKIAARTGLLLSFVVPVSLESVQLHSTPLPSIAEVDMNVSLLDLRPVLVTIAADGQYPEWRTTIHDVQHSPAVWRRMNLANWNTVPEPLFHEGLDSLFARYRHVLANPSLWDGMQSSDWDLVPQPIRTLAYRQMCAYWAGYYRLAARYHLSEDMVADTLAAIVMSESWFDHRASSLNPDGSRDIGLGQASDFARERIRQLHAKHVVDIAWSDDQYYNPWTATRFVAIWMSLLLDEARGDLDFAVRAYNRGVARACDRLGTSYRNLVHRRLIRFILNTDSPVAWNYLWWKSQDLESETWPWLMRSGSRGHGRVTGETMRCQTPRVLPR